MFSCARKGLFAGKYRDVISRSGTNGCEGRHHRRFLYPISFIIWVGGRGHRLEPLIRGCRDSLSSAGLPVVSRRGPNWRLPAGERESPRPCGRRGVVSRRGASCGRLRTAERVAKWRTRPAHATQVIGEHVVTSAKRVRHPAPRVANSPRTARTPGPRHPPRGDGPAGWGAVAGTAGADGTATGSRFLVAPHFSAVAVRSVWAGRTTDLANPTFRRGPHCPQGFVEGGG